MGRREMEAFAPGGDERLEASWDPQPLNPEQGRVSPGGRPERADVRHCQGSPNWRSL